MSDIGFDFSEVNALAADLGKVPDAAGGFIRSAVQYTATEVRKSARDTVGSGSHSWSALPNSIDYDIKTDVGESSSLTAEVGYNKGRGAGKLGNLREFGGPSAGNHLAPHNDLANALEANQDDFQKGLEKALQDAENKAGL